MQFKRLVYFLLINILVSTITTLIVLTIWDRSHQTGSSLPVISGPLVMIPTETQANIPQVEVSDTPTVSLQAYQVSAGETLGEIALDFDMTVDQLLDLNGLTDPDSIGTGTTIFVPVQDPSESEGEGELAGSEIDGNTEESNPPVSNDQVEIVAVFGAQDLTSERVQIRGRGDMTLSLTGWRLLDDDGNVYIFPQITLFGSGAVDVYSTAGVDTVVALYWNSGKAVWETGETVTLTDDAGKIQATYIVP
jgi:LysM repeat protein